MRRIVILCASLAGCNGEPAPDAAVCRDFIHRICIAPICEVVTQSLTPGESCDEDLIARTGCGADDFAFAAFSRDRFLECRLPLMRAGASREAKPSCDDVEQSQEICPDVWAF